MAASRTVRSTDCAEMVHRPHDRRGASVVIEDQQEGGVPMKRISHYLLLAAAAALVAIVASASPGLAKELRILAWEGYADDDWGKAFEQQYNVDVNVVFIG